MFLQDKASKQAKEKRNVEIADATLMYIQMEFYLVEKIKCTQCVNSNRIYQTAKIEKLAIDIIDASWILYLFKSR